MPCADPGRYHQLHVLEQLPNPLGLPDHGIALDGISETWFPNEATLLSSAQSLAGAALAADNRTYVERSRKLFFDEQVLFPAPV
ncbi:hypothetical protein [Hydrogenophaga sp. BPS33]|uniref:hypothetical protein n=1 Tax=Hydrogenophaga sp. BPS33 TaxID=2651974 RepID=UPI00131FC1B4|nr:hypothetical protein [Hydrogenophaga sp. BPS33]QHE83900.1 hypothetical protein F9K07_02875 [Hydrogenophaga sp. BPS33]